MRPSLVVLAVLAGLCFSAPWLSPYSPDEQPDPVGGRLRPPGTILHAVALTRGGWMLADEVERLPGGGLRILRDGRSQELAASQVGNLTDSGVADRRLYLLGSDAFSRDVLSRLLHGGRLSLSIGGVSMLMCLVLGVGIGALAALGGPLIDGVLMRVVDGLQALPWFFLLIALRALLPPGPETLVLILGATGWPAMARLTRSEVMRLRRQDFVDAARGLGLSEIQVLSRHVLPNIWTPLAVYSTLTVGYLIVAESALSFLGLGVETPQASWGNMIEQGRHHMARAWWILTLPSAGLVVTVVSLNLFADRLRDVLDPRFRETIL